MTILRRSCLVSVALLLALWNLGCPSEGRGKLDVLDVFLWLTTGAIRLDLVRDEPLAQEPTEVRVTLPDPFAEIILSVPGEEMLALQSSASSSQFLGFFSIDTDFKAPNEFEFPVIRDSANARKACVDFNLDGSCAPDEGPITLDGGNQIVFKNPFTSFTVARGRYSLVLRGNLLKVKTGTKQFAFDVPVDFALPTGNSVRKNMLLLANAQVLPQVAFGTAGGLTIVTQVVVNNPSGQAVEGGVEFFKQDGSPMNVKIGTVTGSEHTFTVPPQSSLILEIDPAGLSVQVGWGFGHGKEPLEFGLVFATFTGGVTVSGSEEAAPLAIKGNLRAEAGIAASGVSTSHVLIVVKTPEGLDTGFAIVNPTGVEATTTLRLKDQTGEKAQKQLKLGPRRHTARFFGEFFGVNVASFQGTLEIKSDTAIAVTSLRTLNGEQSSSLPPGSRQ